MIGRLCATLAPMDIRHTVVVLGLALALAACGTEASEDPSMGASQTTQRSIPDSMTVVRVLETDDRFSTLRAVLDSTGLDSILTDAGPYTLFAPPNAAFEALPPGTMATLLTDRPDQLRAILERHIVRERQSRTQLARTDTLVMLRGGVGVRGAGDSLRVAEARVVDGDVAASNGVVHVLDRVLQPPASTAENPGGG